MNLENVIDYITSSNQISSPVFARVSKASTKKLYVHIFGNSQGYPSMYSYDFAPELRVKTGSILVKELITWRDSSTYFKPENEIYIVIKHVLIDGSHEFRHFKVDSVEDKDNCLLLISNANENLEMREHYKHLTEDMYDYSDDDD